MPKNKTKTKIIKEGLRMPRPKGITSLIHSLHLRYQKSPKDLKSHLKQMKKLLIEQWILSSNMLNGQTMSIDELANYLNLTRTKTQRYINNTTIQIANMFDNNADQIRSNARVKFLQALFWASETMALTSQQTRILMASQGAGYKPFLSRDVNGAIANQIAAQKPLLEILRAMQDKQPTYLIPAIIQGTDGTSTKNVIHTDQALKLIRENSQSVLENPQILQLPESVPDINPNTQKLSEIQIPVVLTDKPSKQSQFSHGSRDKEGHIIDDAEAEDFQA